MRNIREKNVPVRRKNSRNISRPRKNRYKIVKTKKIKKYITSKKKPYIRSSNEIKTKSIYEKSSLPRIKPTDIQ